MSISHETNFECFNVRVHLAYITSSTLPTSEVILSITYIIKYPYVISDLVQP